MQVWASVNEADIGRIRRYAGAVHRRCPSRRDIPGKVTQIRMNAQMTQNVVTYTVVVTTDNPEGKLLPYLTANVQFEVEQRSHVLIVPNAALGWSPQPSQISPEAGRTLLRQAQGSEHGCLWIDAGGRQVRPLAVNVGIYRCVSTEVSGET